MWLLVIFAVCSWTGILAASSIVVVAASSGESAAMLAKVVLTIGVPVAIGRYRMRCPSRTASRFL